MTAKYDITPEILSGFKRFCGKSEKPGFFEKLFKKQENNFPDCFTTLKDDLIRSRDFNGTNTYKYTDIIRIVGVNKCCYVFMKNGKAMIIPREAFAEDREFFAFFATIMKETGLQIELGQINPQ